MDFKVIEGHTDIEYVDGRRLQMLYNNLKSEDNINETEITTINTRVSTDRT